MCVLCVAVFYLHAVSVLCGVMLARKNKTPHSDVGKENTWLFVFLPPIAFLERLGQNMTTQDRQKKSEGCLETGCSSTLGDVNRIEGQLSIHPSVDR